jgi:HAD superfamily hydrolase (TIGR01509 family)
MATVVVDVDGTLVDSNYHHALAWRQALREHDVVVPMWTLHRHVGMGGDQFVAAVAGEDVERRAGDAVRAAHDRLFMDDFIENVTPLPGARLFLEGLVDRGMTVVLASSANEAEIDYYLDQLDARAIVEAWTTSADVRSTKPDPDLIEAAVQRGKSGAAVMIGDTTRDCIAAKRMGLWTVAVLTGGFGHDELSAAGAFAVVESVDALRADPDPLVRAFSSSAMEVRGG